jgi:hypothetical protein
LIWWNGRAFICDVGSSRFTSGDGTLTGTQITVEYAAPELFDEQAGSTRGGEAWTFALILYEILTGSAAVLVFILPFDVIQQLRRHQ